MFPYDQALLAALQPVPQSIADVVQIMQSIEATCIDADGLKWFNWLYLQVTLAVNTRENAGGFANPTWLAQLDVQFARLYFNALAASLSGQSYPKCWQALFSARGNTRIARIQFALAGINAHIDHDLPEAIATTAQLTGTASQHGNSQYNDYTALNSTLDTLIDSAKQTLSVRLLGDALPPVSHLEDTLAAWSLSAAREQAWKNAGFLWHLQSEPAFASQFLATLDALTAVASKTLLVPVP